jgi:hypothetical protein
MVNYGSLDSITKVDNKTISINENGEIEAVLDMPVGSIIAWASHIHATLPENWVLCDGSVISDERSLINGVTTPNLNGDHRFLRGASSSGGTGGSEEHNHTIASQDNIEDTGSGEYVRKSYTSTENHLPPYYNIIWIMRVW